MSDTPTKLLSAHHPAWTVAWAELEVAVGALDAPRVGTATDAPSPPSLHRPRAVRVGEAGEVMHEEVGEADFTLGPRDWPGTYLEWLPDQLLRLIFGPLQLLCTLEAVRMKAWENGFCYDPDAYVIDASRQLADWGGKPFRWYFFPAPRGWKRSGKGHTCIDVWTAAETARVIQKLRDDPNTDATERARRYKRMRDCKIEYVLWFSDVLLRYWGLHMPFSMFRADDLMGFDHTAGHDISYTIDHGDNAPARDWTDRSTWPSCASNAWQRAGCTFEKPQHRFLGDIGGAKEGLLDYSEPQRSLYNAERRAYTTDLRGGDEAYELERKARWEWGSRYRDSNHVRVSQGLSPRVRNEDPRYAVESDSDDGSDSGESQATDT